MMLRLLTGSMVFFVLGSMAAAQSPMEKLRLAYSAIGGSQASVWIPYEAGIFRKHGLEVELLYVGGGGRAAQVVQSGEVPIGVFTGGAVINSNLAGGDLVMIASSMNVTTFAVMARPEIRRVEDLKGKKIGISRFGSATDFGLRSQWLDMTSYDHDENFGLYFAVLKKSDASPLLPESDEDRGVGTGRRALAPGQCADDVAAGGGGAAAEGGAAEQGAPQAPR